MSQSGFFDESSSSDFDFYASQSRRQVQFYGTVEKAMYKNEKENQNKLNRIAEVRRQEAEHSRQKVEERKKKKMQNLEEEEIEEKLQQYIKMKKLQEDLLKAKELGQAEIGKAHRDAELSAKLKEDKDEWLREENLRHAEATKYRTAAAFDQLRQQDEEMNGPRRRLLETKKNVQKSESERAHLLAAEYRDKEKDQPEEKDDFVSYQPFNKNISRGVFHRKVNGDYSKSHLHNSVVVSHKDEDGQISAFEAARLESEKAQSRKTEFMSTQDVQRKKSLNRWREAVDKENTKKEKELFESHMERLKKAQNQLKIEEGKKYPEMQTKPATTLQTKARTQKEAEKAFEDLFLRKENKVSVSEGARKSGKENNRKSLNKSTRPPSANPKTPKDNRPTERSLLSGFGNNTQRTDDWNQQHLTFDENEERSLEESSRTETRQPTEGSSKKELKTKVIFSKNDPMHQSISEHRGQESDQEDEEEKSSSSLSVSPEKEDQTEDFNESKYSQGNTKSQPFTSYAERKHMESQNPVDPASMRPMHLQRGYSSSYQQAESSMAESSHKHMDDLGQSQSSGFSDSRMKSDKFGESRNAYSSYQDHQQQKVTPVEEIKDYINQHEQFLRKLDQDRKKLNEQLKTSIQPEPSGPLTTNQPKQKVVEKSEKPKATLPKPSDEEEKALEELHKKTNDLLTRFMAPPKEQDSDEDSDNEIQQGSLFKSKQFEASKSEKQPAYNKSQGANRFQNKHKDEEQDETPEKNSRFRSHRRESSSDEEQSELDYSMSERNRSEKKSYANTTDLRNDYTTSFGGASQATGTFGRTNAPAEMQLSRLNNDSRKPWQMNFNNKEDDRDEEQEDEDEEERQQDQKAWKMEFSIGDERQQTQQTRGREAQNEKVNKEEDGQGPSLAELFQKNRKKMIEKYEKEKEHHKEKVEHREATKPTRTKEEILRQRKAMMDYKGPLDIKAKEKSAQANSENQNAISGQFGGRERKSSKDPKPELLDRLALGKKAKVTKKDMHALTSKNYELLPEVKKRKEEEKKKEEMKKRRENVKKLEQDIRNKTVK